MPFEKGGYAAAFDADREGGDHGRIDTLINEKGLPPVPHSYWVDRLGFQQDDPVTDFRSGGVSCLCYYYFEGCAEIFSIHYNIITDHLLLSTFDAIIIYE